MDLVLIVHKDESVRDEISAALSEAGCGFLAVGTAEEGLGLMGDASFPVAMVGLDLPGMSGIDLVREAGRLNPEMEVVALPGSATIGTAVSCIHAGASDFLPGPYSDPDRVTAAVARAVEKGRKARERKTELESLMRKNEVLEATNRFLAEQVKRDALTCLYNHGYFQEVLALETARAGRYHRSFSLLFADLDHFKRYNDLQGHLAGDKALVLAADIFRRNVRRTDFVARYGGEEFVVLLPETPKDKAVIVAERIRAEFESHPFAGREAQPGGALTISVGISGFPEDGLSPLDLVRAADVALYTAKRKGGNTYRLAG